MIDLPPPERVDRMTGTEVLETLRTLLNQERLECAALADGMAERLARSGRHAEAMTAMQIAAQIRARR